MGTVAIVPIRGAHEAKTRLSPLFSGHERVGLAWSMLRHVLDVLGDCPAVDQIVVVTREPDETLRQVGPDPRRTILFQPVGHSGLNAALDLGRDWAVSNGYEAMLVLPADLPMLDVADVREMIRAGKQAVIAPDRHGSGTNALFLAHGPLILRRFVFAFGTESFQHHHAEARRHGIEMATTYTPGLQRDLDTPDDWQELPIETRQSLLASVRCAMRTMTC